MDSRFKLSLLGAVVFAVSPFTGAAMTGAAAADLLPPPPIVEAPEVVTKSGTGWYLRGDISYDFQKVDGYHYTPATNSVTDFARAELDDSYNIGLGIGYQISQNFRADLTLDYVFSAHMDGSSCTTGGAFACSGGTQPGPFYDRTDMSRLDLLANAYYDIGTFGKFTPYVGAGIGGSYVKYDNLNNTNVPSGGTINDNHEGQSTWRFAYALHAGAAVSLSSNLKLDLGYSYKHIEGGASHAFSDAQIAAVPGLAGRDFIYDKGIEDHVIRAGLRYQFGH